MVTDELQALSLTNFLILSLCYSFQSGMDRFMSPMGLPSWKGLVVFLEETSLSMSYSTLLRSAYIKIPVIILRLISNAWTASFKSELTLFKLECNLLEVHVIYTKEAILFPQNNYLLPSMCFRKIRVWEINLALDQIRHSWKWHQYNLSELSTDQFKL